MIQVPRVLHEITVWNTSLCNLRCKYCFVYRLYPQGRAVMSKDIADALVNFGMSRLRPNGVLWFFGGEPLLAFNSMKYITERFRAEGFVGGVGATTNGTLITEERIKWMREVDFGLLISIDGTKEAHDKYRVFPDGRGSWEYVINGIRLVKKYLGNVRLRWTFTPDTVEGLAEGHRYFVEKMGICDIAADAVYEVHWRDKDIERLKEELLTLKDYYVKWYMNGIPIFSMFIRDAVSALLSKRRNWMSRCGLGLGSVGVSPDGKIYPCHRFVSSRSVVIGDVRTGFYPSRLEWIRKWLKYPPYSEEPELCRDCPFKNACTGGCIAMNYDLFGDPHIVPKSFCLIKRAVVEVFKDTVRELLKKRVPLFEKLYLRKSVGRYE